MSIYVEVRVRADIPDGFYDLLRSFREEKDDDKAKELISKMRVFFDNVACKSFVEGKSFDINAYHPSFYTIKE